MVSAVADAIKTRFRTEIETGIGMPVVYDNGTHRDEWPLWCRFSVQFGGESTRLVSVGGPGQRRYRTIGQAVAEVYMPAGKGEEPMRAVHDAVTAAFRTQWTEPDITFGTPSLTTGFRDGAWWKRNVQIPFRADEIA